MVMLRVALMGLMLGGVAAVPRQLQAGGRPDKCNDDASFQAWLSLVNAACCTTAASACSDGLPTSCDQECANVLKPFKSACKSQLRTAGLTQTINQASRNCPTAPANTRGCPKTIPALVPGAAQSCGSGDGFWPIGSVCPVSCAAAPGGGHRRAQVGGTADYICTQGGDWLAASPLSCASRPPPLAGGGSPSQGRFMAVDQPMSITQAISYCRQNYAALASIHSWEEQQQVVSACLSMVSDPSTGETVHGDQAAYGGYGCWIGFEDSASEGGFIWEDGSSVDFVHWTPGEPNGADSESAVVVDLRGRMGSQDIWLPANGFRSGEWNDDSRSDGQLLYPVCETSIPQAIPGVARVWGTGATSSFNIKVCVDGTDTLFFQDDRLWMQYGGNWAAAGQGSDCGQADTMGQAGSDSRGHQDYAGKAYVNEQVWDISALAACQPGSTCPVSDTFTDSQFAVPMGCGRVAVTVQKNAVRGQITVTEPNVANGWRGELMMEDPYADRAVFDFDVSLECIGSRASRGVRLSCLHSVGESECKMGRIEAFNPRITRPGAPAVGAWGTVCGHYYWDNNNLANTVCRSLGYSSGETYTFGATSYLPSIPVVAGWRICHGGESDIFSCEAKDVTFDGGRPVQDPDCINGCVGADGVQGTADDTIDSSCPHAVDQGAICYSDAAPSQLNVPVCRGCGSGGCALATDTDQPVIFGCIDYYTTNCIYDITGNIDTPDLQLRYTDTMFGSYNYAMRAFATCAQVSPEPPGYCHGSLASAADLSNHGVCSNGATTDIGFHIRIPFLVNQQGDYSFRIHADYGSGSFMGVDGAEYTPGDLWGHVNVDATSLAMGDHEFDVLGFEPCCDGHAELEVHLPCDDSDSPWRTVVHGGTECMTCSDDAVDASCSMDTESAGCCGASGGHVVCHPLLEDGSCDTTQEDAATAVGRFIAVPETMNQVDARQYCQQHYVDLASIHSPSEQSHAASACMQYASPSNPTDDPTTPEDESLNGAFGCWIGFTDEATEGGFIWLDGTSVGFVNFAPGEPNDISWRHPEDQATAGPENMVEMDLRAGTGGDGEWNDVGAEEMFFPVCELMAYDRYNGGAASGAEQQPPMVWGTGQTASFNIQVCIDHVDTLYFQDDRLWLTFGGQYAAAGAHASCPDRYAGRAFVGRQEWDISGLAQCEQGVGCPVSRTFTDEQFLVPMGCNNIGIQATKNFGRGTIATFAPTPGNAYRGEIEISDEGFGGADVYDVTVTLTCLSGGGLSTPTLPVRLSCTHNAQAGQDGPGCHMGRVEVYNTNALHEDGRSRGTWGTVCGHYVWDNDNMADTVCRQLGFASGTVYTFGTTHLLPTLPIVAGFVTCAGGEANIFNCPEASTRIADRDCEMGCTGADGVPGTADDTIDPRCTHLIDQGVICEVQDTPQRLNPAIERCSGAGAGMCASCDTTSQPIVFACIEYYTTQCEYDITHNELANGLGSYMTAMQAFAACADVTPEPAGYCHGSLLSASHLANHEVCLGTVDDPSTPDVDESQGATENIGFHIRVPFIVNLPGLYTFRYHMDMGLGSFMGVDGPEFRPGNAWGHVETGGQMMATGEHEWEVLGFEDCCDGHAELEVHLPCEARGGSAYLRPSNDPLCPAGGVCAETQGIYAQGKREYLTVVNGQLTVEHYNPNHCCTGTATRTPGTESACGADAGQWCQWAGTYDITYSNGFATTHIISPDGLVTATDHDGAQGNSPWRVITHGTTGCLSCNYGGIDANAASTCSVNTEPAACCRQEGNGCQDLGLDQSTSSCSVGGEVVCGAVTGNANAGGSGCDMNAIPTTAHVGRFVAVGRPMNWNDAISYCEEQHTSLASIHSWEEQQQAAAACEAYADATETQNTGYSNAGHGDNKKYGCWIGFQDLGREGGFVWIDGSSVEYVDWAPGEPNGVDDAGDEDAVELDFRQRLTRFGEWNDATLDQGYEMYPLCETSIPPPVPGAPMTWGTETTQQFRLKICIDHIDDVFFQDDRLWIQYGGAHGAPGTHDSCPDRYAGKAYVNNAQWDITSLGNCEAGSSCPVSPTFTDEQFEVPMGCSSVTVDALKLRGRGQVTTEAPSAGNGWRGGLHIADWDESACNACGGQCATGCQGFDDSMTAFAGAAVYDIRVTLTCVGTARSAPQHPVRLSCAHNFGTDSCHMGRVEVFNPNAMHVGSASRGTWGSVCGHYFWDNHNMADIVCRQLGYSSGEVYTFGHSSQLPTLPIVAGFRVCEGTEANIFACPPGGALTDGDVDDPDCAAGCLGADGLQGTVDDTLDHACTHSIDQGAICHNDGQPSQIALPGCMGCGATGVCDRHRTEAEILQPVIFGCIDFYSTECLVDGTHMDGTVIDNALGGGDALVSYMSAMRTFAQCVDANIEVPGYCHGSLTDAKALANHQVCSSGVTHNIGFHIRIPFNVHVPGTYTFRLHADYGYGAFVGVDGAEFQGGDWAHSRSIEMAPMTLGPGEHEFESLGFEDCCDGNAELEVHLPCDATASPWRYVTSGETDCLICGGPVSAECSPSTGR